MQVIDLCKTRVITVTMDDPLSLIGQLFERAHIHHLPVLNSQDYLVGMISDRDYLQAISPYTGTPAEIRRDSILMQWPAHKVMSRKLHTVNLDVEPADAASLMLEYNISAVPVADGQKLLGIISWRDLLRIQYAAD